jgi:small subunit ribosomal protein S5
MAKKTKPEEAPKKEEAAIAPVPEAIPIAIAVADAAPEAAAAVPADLVVVPVPEEEAVVVDKNKQTFNKSVWKPRTSLGKKVKDGEIKDIDEILDKGIHIMEAEIVDALLPGLESDMLFIGQAKGKFGGGKRRVFRQTQKKSPEGNKPKFGTYAVLGNKDGYVGLGYGKSKETVPAREKAMRNAKLQIIKVKRGCGSWACGCKTPHSIPFAVEGKVGSSYIKLMPAPKGAGLVVESECAKVLQFAGIRDVYSRTDGQTRTRVNLLKACIAALKRLSDTRIQPDHNEKLGIADGKIKKQAESE